MPSIYRGPEFTLTTEVEQIDVTSQYPSPNESWRVSDENGHEHRYDHGYPTLTLVVDESHWCDGTEGIALHDPHEAVDESHYECSICRVVIEPAMDPPGMTKMIPGVVTYTLTGFRSDGAEVTAWIDEDEMATIGADPSAARRVLDAVPDERIRSLTFASR